MFEYRYTVTSTSDGYEWGLFKTRAQAAIMRNALEAKFGQANEVFEVTEIK